MQHQTETKLLQETIKSQMRNYRSILSCFEFTLESPFCVSLL